MNNITGFDFFLCLLATSMKGLMHSLSMDSFTFSTILTLSHCFNWIWYHFIQKLKINILVYGMPLYFRFVTLSSSHFNAMSNKLLLLWTRKKCELFATIFYCIFSWLYFSWNSFKIKCDCFCLDFSDIVRRYFEIALLLHPRSKWVYMLWICCLDGCQINLCTKFRVS